MSESAAVQALKIAAYVLITAAYIVLTPLNLVYTVYTIYYPDLFRRQNSHSNHARKVKDVQNQVKKWTKRRKGRMCTDRPWWKSVGMRSLNKTKWTTIHINLEDIIEIDTENKTLRVEPGMMMGTLTSKLIPLGWTIPVVPEIMELTVGGCISGSGIESTSHIFGTFFDTCLSLEVVFPDGTLVSCSPDENSELFYSIPMSHATVGFITSVTLPIIPALRYVKVEYIPSSSISEAVNLLQNEEHEFVEGITYSMNESVIIYGDMVNGADPKKINSILSWNKPWFYKHVEGFLKKPGPHIEYIPLRDYYHRHQRGRFWDAAYFMPHGNTPIFRYLFGYVFMMNLHLIKLLVDGLLPFFTWSLKYDHVIQDCVIPITKMQEAIAFNHQEVEVYPIWICPCRAIPNEYLRPREEGVMYVALAIKGKTPKIQEYNMAKTRKTFEKFILDNKGYQPLHADTYLTRDEFREMFDHRLYDNSREAYNCKRAFPEVYEKTKGRI